MTEDIKLFKIGSFNNKPVYKCTQGFFIGVSGISLYSNEWGHSWVVRHEGTYLKSFKIDSMDTTHSSFVEACNCLYKRAGVLYRNIRHKRLSRTKKRFYNGVELPRGITVRLDRPSPEVVGHVIDHRDMKSSRSYVIGAKYTLQEIIEIELKRQKEINDEVMKANSLTLEEATLILKEIPKGTRL